MPKRGGAKSEYNLLIGGQLVPGADSIEVINPANEELLALCPRADEQQLNEAIAAAKAAYPRWASLPLADRRNYILRFADALEAQSAAMAHLLTEEQGKPLAEAEVEVGASLLFLRHIAAFELHPKIIEDNDVRRVEMRRKPLGVVAGIIPWNFPLLLASWLFFPATR
jgi:acyl-CoA reductase-like NAD-dependent aldehyde dehydrogenase